ncbi:hypothetical protein GQ55_9G629800 [Panicum hallii var. hallii]|uniref:Uncharacterized protein n=1 Tax=Panicum hallii var. hallii TaxID=1504633 RepID=A0A2T7CI63_9POAL|nr:hypothetical protein GQ55_9G629800 [Panicum hallii var. hallii]
MSRAASARLAGTWRLSPVSIRRWHWQLLSLSIDRSNWTHQSSDHRRICRGGRTGVAGSWKLLPAGNSRPACQHLPDPRQNEKERFQGKQTRSSARLHITSLPNGVCFSGCESP